MSDVYITELAFDVDQAAQWATLRITWSNDRHQIVRRVELSPSGLRAALLAHVELIDSQVREGLLPASSDEVK